MPRGALVGHAVSAETREKIAATRRRDMNVAWKGENAKYAAKHLWLHRNAIKTGVCSWCDAVRKTEWANVSGEYHHDPADYIELCVPCHRLRDFSRIKRLRAIGATR